MCDHHNERLHISLGIMYQLGQCVPKNYVQAHFWTNLAASRFPASQLEMRDNAIKIRDLLDSMMTPAPKPVTAIKRLLPRRSITETRMRVASWSRNMFFL